jgi:hypothetical protein
MEQFYAAFLSSKFFNPVPENAGNGFPNQIFQIFLGGNAPGPY